MSLDSTLSNSKYSDRFYKRLIWIFSVVIFFIVLILSRLPRSSDIPEWVPYLPSINAFLNGSTFVILLFSYYFIRRKRIAIHRKLNITASILSVFFLICYVTFHSFGVETHFPQDNPLRPLYLIILSTHIILAAVVLPLVLLSLYRGLTMQVVSHRKLTRWSFPIWLYVTLSGVIVYLMISPYYKF